MPGPPCAQYDEEGRVTAVSMDRMLGGEEGSPVTVALRFASVPGLHALSPRSPPPRAPCASPRSAAPTACGRSPFGWRVLSGGRIRAEALRWEGAPAATCLHPCAFGSLHLIVGSFRHSEGRVLSVQDCSSNEYVAFIHCSEEVVRSTRHDSFFWPHGRAACCGEASDSRGRSRSCSASLHVGAASCINHHSQHEGEASLRPPDSEKARAPTVSPGGAQKESFEIHLEWGASGGEGERPPWAAAPGSSAEAAAATLQFPRRAFIASTQACWRLICCPQAPDEKSLHQARLPVTAFMAPCHAAR